VDGETSSDDVLRATVAEMRSKLDALLDDALVRLSANPPDDPSHKTADQAPPAVTPARSGTSSDRQSTTFVHFQNERRRAARPQPAAADSRPSAAPASPATSGDAESRLHALAQRLEGRLKKSKDRPTDEHMLPPGDPWPAPRFSAPGNGPVTGN
jgi:hypothetical protein